MYQSQAKFSGNLHALRGLAAVAVIFYHAKAMNGIGDVGWMNVAGQMGAGVTLFFILSGFSLSLSNYSHIDKAGWLRAYSIKRIARIMPVWYAFIAITWLNHYFHINYTLPSNTVIFSAVPFFPIIPGREQGLVWAGWTVGVELMFYAIFPILIVLLRNNLKAWGLALLALIVVSMKLRGYAGDDATQHFLHNSFPRQAFIFIMGCTFFFIVQRATMKDRERPLSFVMLALSVIFFGLWIAQTKGLTKYHYDYWLVVKAFALSSLTAFAYLNPKFKNVPQLNLYNPVTKFFGDKSYTIYLSHPIIVSWTKQWIEPIFEAVPNAGLALFLYALIVLAFSCAAAAVISTLIEEPLYKRGRAMAKKEMTKKETADVSTPAD